LYVPEGHRSPVLHFFPPSSNSGGLCPKEVDKMKIKLKEANPEIMIFFIKRV
jgi:hypothetical protein